MADRVVGAAEPRFHAGDVEEDERLGPLFEHRLERLEGALEVLRPVGIPHVVHRLADRELVGLARRAADGEDRRALLLGDRAPLRRRVADEDHGPGGRVDRLAVHVERRLPGKHQVELLLAARAEPHLVVLADYVPVTHRPVGAHPESLDAEVPADVERDTTVVLGAGLDVLERDDVVRLRNCRDHARAPFRDRASCATCSVASNALVPASIGCIRGLPSRRYSRHRTT